MRHQQMISALVLSALPFLSTPVMAEVVCLSGNTDTCIQETAENNRVRYSITNNLDTRIVAFGVTNTSDSEDAESWTDEDGWSGEYVNQADWDAGEYEFIFIDRTNNTNGPNNVEDAVFFISGLVPPTPTGENGEPIELNLITLGSYASIFGTQENYASIFWNIDLITNPLTNGVTLADNFFSETPDSEFATFGLDGTVVSSSLSSVPSVSAVPEPETYAMFLAGLGLLGLMRRKA